MIPDIHSKQFILYSKPVLINSDWITKKLDESLYLSYCPKLKIIFCRDQDGLEWCIAGSPTLQDDPKERLTEVLAETKSSDVAAKTNYWGGRWALISKYGIINDASSIIGLFYDSELTIISSSPALIDHVLQTAIKKKNSPLTAGYYFNWYLTPGTFFQDIKKLLTSQKIDISNGRFVIGKKYLIIEKLNRISYDKIYEQLSRLLTNEIIYIRQQYNIHVALSSGYDSRLIYSLAKTAIGEDFASYTQVYPSIPPDDFRIPEKLSHNHKIIKRGRFDAQKLQQIDDHNLVHVLDADRIFYSYGQWNAFTSSDACLRGSILEMGGMSSAHLYDAIPAFTGDIHDAKVALWSLQDFRDFQFSALTEYFTWTNDSHKILIDGKKRFYWEQRIGGWLSYIEQSLDILPFSSFQIGNSLYCINLFLNIPYPVMKVKPFHIDFMRENTPELLNYKFNNISRKDKIEQFYKMQTNGFMNRILKREK